MTETLVSTDEARVPLLSSQDSSLLESEAFDVSFPVQDVKQGRVGPRGGGGRPQGNGGALKRGRSEQAYLGKKQQQYSGSEMIVAVFVVAFDTKKGNVVEWKYPSEVALEGIEFKSMASGLHKITKDFIYFKQRQLFGLSCFEKIPVANEEERGARMKSVGLLAVGYLDLHLHMEFLQKQVRSHVESPGEYGSLEEYFRHYRNPQILPSSSVPVLPTNQQSPICLIQHPVGCCTQFLELYGPKVFVLWRLALLKKRILLFSPPPIGSVCHRVYCTCLLSAHGLPLNIDTECNPQFYINVADIDHMQSLDSYVACTTEKIFQSKVQLYDVFVDGVEFESPSERVGRLLRTSLWDQRRVEHLSNIRSRDLTAAGKNRDDLAFAEYFQELNSQLFRVMLDAAHSEDHVLTVDMVEGVQLDPVKDRFFLSELASIHNWNMTVQQPTDMFTCCL